MCPLPCVVQSVINDVALHIKYWHTATPHLTFITDDDGEATQSSDIERLCVVM